MRPLGCVRHDEHIVNRRKGRNLITCENELTLKGERTDQNGTWVGCVVYLRLASNGPQPNSLKTAPKPNVTSSLSNMETTEPETVTVMLRSNLWVGSKDAKKSIIRLIKKDPGITLSRISEKTGIERNKVARIIKSMKEEGLIQRIGGTRGRWEICS